MTKKIPRLSLRLNSLLDKAECFEGLYTYSSDLEHTAFITDGEDILIITSKSGYLRLPGYQVDKLAEELKYIKEDNERFRKRKQNKNGMSGVRSLMG